MSLSAVSPIAANHPLPDPPPAVKPAVVVHPAPTPVETPSDSVTISAAARQSVVSGSGQ